MNTLKLLHTVDSISTWVGKAFAWLIVVLMVMVMGEVFKRYALNAPTAWIFEASNMLYGTAFMMCGAYTLSQDGHVRGDFFTAAPSHAHKRRLTLCCTSCSSFQA